MNVLFAVKNKNNNDKYDVYDVTYNKAGYPHFLIYKDGQWVRMSAKHFRPYTSEDWAKEFENMHTLTCEELRWYPSEGTF